MKQKRSSLKPASAAKAAVGVVARNSPEVYPAPVSARSSGVGKFYSKIRHTIEDNLTPKISGKLYKGGKHSKSMTALSSLDSSVGKYTLTSSKSSGPAANKIIIKDVRTTTTTSTISQCEENASAISNYFTQNPSCSYVDSDEDEAQLSLNLVKTSLEDEIFEELEKVAHDESKLNAVLKTFDKIMFDYNDPLPPQTKTNDAGGSDQKPLLDMGVKAAVEADKQASIVDSVVNNSDKGLEADANNRVTDDQQSQTDCLQPSNGCANHHSTKLEKSSSSLSLTRRKCYQSPDSPCLRQMRHVFVQQQRQKSKSVWELSNSTKIPILKTMPLQKRSKSFCYQSTDHSPSRSELNTNQSMAPAKTVLAKGTAETKTGKSETKRMSSTSGKKMSRTTKYVNVKPSSLSVLNDQDSNCGSKKGSIEAAKSSSASPPKPKTESKVKTRSGDSQPRRTNSNSNLLTKVRSSALVPPPTPPRRSRTSDELLDKCLEKGQQILRKVESLNTQQRPTSGTGPANKKTIVRVKSNTSSKSSKDNLTLRRKKIQQKLNYANEDKILPPSLESCRIIPPNFAETSKKHAELLVNVVQLANATRSTPQRQMSADSGIAGNSFSSLEFMSPSVTLATKDLESDSDDSGHISNENMEVTNNQQPSNSSSTTSLNDTSAAAKDIAEANLRRGDGGVELCAEQSLPEFIVNPQRVCTTCRITQVDSVKLIRTHVEIYPNFTKEVTIRLH